MIEITAAQAPEMLFDVMRAGLVPMITSSPGLGKSSIAKQIAKDNGLKVIDLRLSQCDPSDLLGFPSVDKDKNKAAYIPMSTFPVKGDKVPKGYNGWLLFLDEFNSAPLSVQAAAYKIVLDHQVGLEDLHENVVIMGAGNLMTDKAIVTRMSTAMESRMIHFKLRLDKDAWIDWASANKIDHRVISYVQYRPEILHRFDPDHDDATFPCPRTWEFVSKLIQGKSSLNLTHDLPIIAGTIGEGTAREFVGFCDIYTSLPTLQQLLADPTGVPIPAEPSHLYGLTGLIGNHLTSANASALMKVVDRMGIEFQVITVRSGYKRNKDILSQPEVSAWVSKNAKLLA